MTLISAVGFASLFLWVSLRASTTAERDDAEQRTVGSSAF
jgi:hypothetical protein